MNFPDCLGSGQTAIAISILCVLVFIDYLRVSRIWLKASKRYQGPLIRNPWLIQSIIFVFCGICGYLTIALSLFSIELAVWTKLGSLFVLKVADEIFIHSALNQAFVVAKEAELGRSLLFISSQVELGLIPKDQAVQLLNKELEKLDLG